MRGIILAAGRGSRMGGLTADRPKCLVELAGRPLLDWQLGALAAGGIDEVGIVSGYRSELLERRSSRTFHNPHWAETNMVGSLLAADAWLSEDACLVSYADIFYAPGIVADLAAATAAIAIAYDPAWLALWGQRFEDPCADGETFRLDAKGFVAEIGGRISDLARVQGQYMGLLKFTPAGWGLVRAHLGSLGPARVAGLDMTSLLQQLIVQGHQIGAVPNRDPWGEADHAGDLALYEGLIGAGAVPLPQWLG